MHARARRWISASRPTGTGRARAVDLFLGAVHVGRRTGSRWCRPDRGCRKVIANAGTRFGGDCADVVSAYNVWASTDPCSATDTRAPTGFRRPGKLRLPPGGGRCDDRPRPPVGPSADRHRRSGTPHGRQSGRRSRRTRVALQRPAQASRSQPSSYGRHVSFSSRRSLPLTGARPMAMLAAVFAYSARRSNGRARRIDR